MAYLFADSSELREGTLSHLDKVTSAKVIDVPNLSDVAGCDWIISLLDRIPTSVPLVKLHVKHGAYLVERKSGLDLVSSLLGKDKHLYHQAMRIMDVCNNANQAILLHTGDMISNLKGMLVWTYWNGTGKDGSPSESIRRITSRYKYEHFANAQSKFKDRTGLIRWEKLTCNEEIPVWVERKVRHLEEYKVKKTKSVPSPRFVPYVPLQSVGVTNEASQFLMMFDGIGIKYAGYLLEKAGCLGWALEYLTDFQWAGTIKGIGKGAIAQAKQMMGLQKEKILVVPDDMVRCEKHYILYSPKYTGVEECPLCDKEV